LVFFGSTAFIILITVFGILGFWNTLLAELPIFSFNSSTRMIALLPICMGIVGAVGLDQLSQFRANSTQTIWAALGFVLLTGIALVIPNLNPNYLGHPIFITQQLFITAVEIAFIGLIIVILINFKKPTIRNGLALVFVLFAFGDFTYLLYDYNGASNPQTFFPEPSGIRYILDHQQKYERILPLSNRVMVPTFPLYYSINALFGHWWNSSIYRDLTSNIDSGLFYYGVTTQPIFSPNTINLDSPLIDIFRVKYIIYPAKSPVSPWKNGIVNQVEYNDIIRFSNVNKISQGVIVKRDLKINSLQLRIDSPSLEKFPVVFTLSIDNRICVNMVLPFSPVGASGWSELKFPEQKVVSGQELVFSITPIQPSQDVAIHFANFDIYPEGMLFADEKKLNGDLAFNIIGDNAELEKKYRLVYNDDIMIYENLTLPISLPIVYKTRYADEQNCASVLKDADLTLEALVTNASDNLFQNSPLPEQVKGLAKIVFYSNNQVTIQADMDQKGLVVFSDSWFPGWVAKVDGVNQNILRVNCNMRGVVVNEGSHRIEMRYVPNSIKLGSSISVLTLIALMLWHIYSSNFNIKK
jgi:hypothetical protein